MKYFKYFVLLLLASCIACGFFRIYFGVYSWFNLICTILNIAFFVFILCSSKPKEPEWVSREMSKPIDLKEAMKNSKAIEFKVVNPKEVE
jgi:hypothetical protein